MRPCPSRWQFREIWTGAMADTEEHIDQSCCQQSAQMRGQRQNCWGPHTEAIPTSSASDTHRKVTGTPERNWAKAQVAQNEMVLG